MQRGGNWLNRAFFCRAADRFGFNPPFRSYSVGFRSVLPPGPARIIALSGNLAFGNVTVGSSAQATLTIANTGDSPLTVNSISYPVGFSGAWSGTIGAASSQPVTVTFAPTAAISYSGNVISVNANQTSGNNTLAVSGTGTTGTTGPSLLVTSQSDQSVKEYDGTTGAFIRNAATGVGDPLDAIIGADGSLLVTDGQQDTVKRFDWATGTFLNGFASAVGPTGMTISGGNVYVCQENTPEIVRSFDAVTGADVGSFVPTVGAGNPIPRDVKVANGRLYVLYYELYTIEMFDVTTRLSLGLLFPPGTGGLATPTSMAFGPDGNLYVAYGNHFVNRYHPTTGAFLGRFVDTGDRGGIGITWGPDGNLYVASAGVQRYNGTTGVFMDDFVPPGSGGLGEPFHISFASPVGPKPTITLLRWNNTITIGWPAKGFKLQSSPVLPGTNWQDVAGSETNNSWSVTLGTGNQFYRLKQ